VEIRAIKNTQGWEAGVDANATLINKGVGNSVDWTKMYDPIVAFVFSPKGLMAGASLKGGANSLRFIPRDFFIPVKIRGPLLGSLGSRLRKFTR
jgi:hypothetical protein